MIPQEITTSHLLSAIKLLDEVDYPKANDSDHYDLFFDNKRYPPKMVISRAYRFASEGGKDWSVSQFASGKESFDFLIKRGFPILHKPHKNPDECFTKEDLDFFSAISAQPYNSKDVVHNNQGNFLNRFIWAKNEEWADRLATSAPFQKEGRISWLEQMNSKIASQRFKYYTWYRLHHTEHYSKDVFYTVGISGPHTSNKHPAQLVIKLDCRRNYLTNAQQAVFDQMLADNGVDWKVIPIPQGRQIIEWDELVNTSLNFINSTTDIYLKAVHLFSTNDGEMAARITWNTHGWTKPSGIEGKSKSTADSYEQQFGYAPEEWLFDLDKVIDGYHYARLEPLYTKSGKHTGKMYNLTLFTHDYHAKQWYWVGRIEAAEVIDEALSKKISAIYRQKGWLDEQIDQLEALPGVNHKDYANNWLPEERFNIRFKESQYQVYNMQPFKSSEVPPSGHYNLPSLKNTPLFLFDPANEPDELGIIPGNEYRDSTSARIYKNYLGGLKESINLHRLVQDGFSNLLRQQHPTSKVYTESRKKINGTSIDIHQITPDERHIFYEVKTYPNVLMSIRAAIGQLLEYGFFPQQKLADEFVIVTHLPATSHELNYLDHLSKVTGLCFKHIYFDVEKDAAK